MGEGAFRASPPASPFLGQWIVFTSTAIKSGFTVLTPLNSLAGKAADFIGNSSCVESEGNAWETARGTMREGSHELSPLNLSNLSYKSETRTNGCLTSRGHSEFHFSRKTSSRENREAEAWGEELQVPPLSRLLWRLSTFPVFLVKSDLLSDPHTECACSRVSPVPGNDNP